MTTTILNFFERGTEVSFALSPSYPLVKSIGLPEAFEGEDLDWDALRSKYGEGIYINPNTSLEWREISVATPFDLERRLIHLDSKIVVPGAKIDSFTIQAQRRGVFRDYSWMETGQYCFALTQDGKNIIVGLRGGCESPGELIAMPVGSVSYLESFDGQDLAKEATIREGLEEGGILPSDWRGLKLLGIYRQNPGSVAPSNIFMYLGELNLDFEEILERHQRSMEEYLGEKKKLSGTREEVEFRARKHLSDLALENPGKYAKDAWENNFLGLFSSDPDQILNWLNLKEEPLKHGMYGAIALYFLLVGGEEFFERFKSLSFVKGQFV